jgi:hypothetical protein
MVGQRDLQFWLLQLLIWNQQAGFEIYFFSCIRSSIWVQYGSRSSNLKMNILSYLEPCLLVHLRCCNNLNCRSLWPTIKKLGAVFQIMICNYLTTRIQIQNHWFPKSSPFLTQDLQISFENKWLGIKFFLFSHRKL